MKRSSRVSTSLEERLCSLVLMKTFSASQMSRRSVLQKSCDHLIWAMVLLRSEEKVPLQVYLKKTIVDLRADDAMAAKLANAEYSFETLTAAIMVCAIAPIVAVYPYLLRYFNKGMTLGGVKE